MVLVMPPPIAVTSKTACGACASAQVRARSGSAADISAITGQTQRPARTWCAWSQVRPRPR